MKSCDYRQNVIETMGDVQAKRINNMHKEKIMQNVKEAALCALGLVSKCSDSLFYNFKGQIDEPTVDSKLEVRLV